MRVDYYGLERWGEYALRAVYGAVLFFLTAPLIAVIPLSFNEQPYFTFPIPGFSVRWYEDLLTSPGWRSAFVNSLIVALPVAALASALGILASLGLVWANFRGKAAVIALVLSPLMVPHLIIGVGMYFFYADLGLIGTYWGMLFAHTTLGVPFVVLIVTATLRNFDISLMRAAAMLGAPPTTVFFRVVLPLIMPGVIASAALAFIHSFDEVIVALLIAGSKYRTLPMQLFGGVVDEVSPVITAAATLLIIFSVIVMAIGEWLRRRSENLGGRRAPTVE